MSLLLEDLRLEEKKYKISDKVIEVKGPDAQKYLHSQTTNDIKSLKNGSFQFNSILDTSGKIVTSFLLYKLDINSFQIILDPSHVNSTIDRIEKFHISEDFEINTIQSISVLYLNSSKANGCFFFDTDYLEINSEQNTFDSEIEFKQLKILTGVPELGCEVEIGELINNSRFDELSVDYSKGCYPGQETVSKINTRRGAAYKPVLCILEGEHYFEQLKVASNSKKIGVIKNQFYLDNKTYLYLSLLREYRIDKSSIEIEIDGKPFTTKINYYPYLKPDTNSLSQDLYDCAVEHFYKNENDEAIKYFNLAISTNPLFEDAYESLGVLYGRLEQFDKAIELMDKLKEINPKCMMAFTNLSLYHMKIGNIDTAEKFKSEATFLNFQLLGDEAERKRKATEIEEKRIAEMGRREGMFKQVLEMDHEDAMANNGMGEIELDRMNFLESEKYFRNAISADKKYSVAYLGLAKSLYQQQKNSELKSVLSEGIQVASKNGDLMPANEMQSLLTKINII
jgi:folate-binding protein YgfZ